MSRLYLWLCHGCELLSNSPSPFLNFFFSTQSGKDKHKEEVMALHELSSRQAGGEAPPSLCHPALPQVSVVYFETSSLRLETDNTAGHTGTYVGSQYKLTDNNSHTHAGFVQLKCTLVEVSQGYLTQVYLDKSQLSLMTGIC